MSLQIHSYVNNANINKHKTIMSWKSPHFVTEYNAFFVLFVMHLSWFTRGGPYFILKMQFGLSRSTWHSGGSDLRWSFYYTSFKLLGSVAAVYDIVTDLVTLWLKFSVACALESTNNTIFCSLIWLVYARRVHWQFNIKGKTYLIWFENLSIMTTSVTVLLLLI